MESSKFEYLIIVRGLIIILSLSRAKYPLAIFARALHVLGPRLLMGYDIGCVFQKTISSSSLGPQFAESKSRCCVNAFHGYSHNFACQTRNHPNVIDGVGIEDLETMERIYSSSNQWPESRDMPQPIIVVFSSTCSFNSGMKTNTGTSR